MTLSVLHVLKVMPSLLAVLYNSAFYQKKTGGGRVFSNKHQVSICYKQLIYLLTWIKTPKYKQIGTGGSVPKRTHPSRLTTDSTRMTIFIILDYVIIIEYISTLYLSSWLPFEHPKTVVLSFFFKTTIGDTSDFGDET